MGTRTVTLVLVAFTVGLLVPVGAFWAGRAYERGQLALLFQAVEQGAAVAEANQTLWAAVNKDIEACHDRLVRLTVRRR